MWRWRRWGSCCWGGCRGNRFAICDLQLKGATMTEQDLLLRTKTFALRVLKLIDALPSTSKGRAIASQLVRAGTSVGSNYRAACRGRSRAEFAAKLGTVEEA